jgi:serine/threonine-protein kinase RsbW
VQICANIKKVHGAQPNFNHQRPSCVAVCCQSAGTCEINGNGYDQRGEQMKVKTIQAQQVFFRFKNPRYLRVIRDNTEDIARRMGFEEDQIFELSMAVDEAYTNAIEHSGKVGGESELEIEYLIYENRLEVSVKDSGCGFDSTRLEIPKTLKGLHSCRGRGLGLIRMLSDGFELRSKPGVGTLIKIIKYLQSRQRIGMAALG